MKLEHGKPAQKMIALALATPLLCACSASPSLQESAEANRPGSALPGGRHLILAEVERRQAPTPSVALAWATVTLLNAKRKTDQELCQGTWTFLGKVGEVRPPRAAVSRNGTGNWQLALSWAPRLTACEGIDRDRYFLTLSRHLPAGFRLRDGITHAWFHQGNRHPDGQRIQLADASAS